MWSSIPQMRGRIYDAMLAIALLEPNAVNCLKESEEEIEKIPGGCETGTCPVLNPSQVKPENEKFQIAFVCNNKVFNRIRIYNEDAYKIAKKAYNIAKEAEEIFKKNTDDYKQDKISEERIPLMRNYLKSLAMLTIALKEIYRTHPTIQSEYKRMEKADELQGNQL